MRVIIAGGRDFDDYDKLRRACNYFLRNQSEIETISGCAPGADFFGEAYAKYREYNISYFPAAWGDIEGKPANEIGYTKTNKPYWKLAGYIRNEEMAKYADALIAFWNGKSRGTKHMINLAKKYGLKVRICSY